MKKTVILLISSAIALLANMAEVENLYNKSEYAKAIQEAKASKNEYSNPKLHLLWAKSAEKLSRVNEAMSAYERVVILDDDNVEAKLAVGKIYKDTGRKNLAEDVRKELSNYQLTPAQRNSLNLLQDTDYGTIKSRASIVGGYDSNINASALSSELFDYYGTSVEGEIDTSFAKFNGSLSYVHDLDEKAGWYARGGVMLDYQNNFDADLYNLFYGSVSAGMGYRQNGYNIYVPVNYNKVHYLKKDLLSQVEVEPSLSVSLDREWILNFKARFLQRSYTDTVDQARDDIGAGLGTDLYYISGKDYMYLKGYFQITKASEASTAEFVDKSTFLASAGFNYNLTQSFVTRFDYRYRYALYQTIIKDFNARRRDNFNQFDLRLSYYYDKNIEFYAADQFTVNMSNYVPARYNENIVTFGIGFNY